MKRRILLGCAAAALAAGTVAAQTTDWPTRPVRILVGSAPGGGTDAMARAVADRLGPAAEDARGGREPARAPRTRWRPTLTAKSTDGHTMVMGVSTAHAIAPHLLKLGYDNDKDLVPVAFVGSVPNVLVVNNGLGVNSGGRPGRRWPRRSRAAELRLQRLGQHPAHRGRTVQGRDRHLHHAHPLQGQLRRR